MTDQDIGEATDTVVNKIVEVTRPGLEGIVMNLLTDLVRISVSRGRIQAFEEVKVDLAK